MLTFKGSQLMQEKSSIQACDGYQTYCGLWVQVPQFLQSSSNQLFCELGTLHPGFTSIHAQDPVLEEKTKIIPDVPPTTWALPWSVTYWGWYSPSHFPSVDAVIHLIPEPSDTDRLQGWARAVCFVPQRTVIRRPWLHLCSEVSYKWKWLSESTWARLTRGQYQMTVWCVNEQRAAQQSQHEKRVSTHPSNRSRMRIQVLDSIRPVPEGSSALRLKKGFSSHSLTPGHIQVTPWLVLMTMMGNQET